MKKRVLTFCALLVALILLLGAQFPSDRPFVKFDLHSMYATPAPNLSGNFLALIKVKTYQPTEDSITLFSNAYLDPHTGTYHISFDISKTDFENHFKPNSTLYFFIDVIDVGLGLKVDSWAFGLGPEVNPGWEWKECMSVRYTRDFSPEVIEPPPPPGQINGMVLEMLTQPPVPNVSVWSCINGNETETDENGFFKFPPGYVPVGPGSFDANYTGPLGAKSLSRQGVNPEYLTTQVNYVLHPDSGIEIRPIKLLRKEDWDSLAVYAKDSLGIEQNPNSAFIFGQVKNLDGLPIPDAVVSYEPFGYSNEMAYPAEEIIYFDPVEWKWDTDSYTKILPGYHFSSSYIIFNAQPQYDFYISKVTAVHRITGDTIGTADSMKITYFDVLGDSIINQADIIADDYIPPDPVADLQISLTQLQTYDNLTLTWTAPGDDGTDGQAYLYDIRYSSVPVEEDTFDWWWNIAEVLVDPPKPGPPGSQESLEITADSAAFFLIKTTDEVMNWSEYSNVVGIAESPPPADPIVSLQVLPTVPGNVEIRYSIPSASYVVLKIYDTSGSCVETLLNGIVEPGEHRIIWDGDGGAGIYFARLESDGFVLTEKLILVR